MLDFKLSEKLNPNTISKAWHLMRLKQFQNVWFGGKHQIKSIIFDVFTNSIRKVKLNNHSTFKLFNHKQN